MRFLRGRSIRLRLLTGLGLCLLIFSLSAPSQQTHESASLHGTVRDSHGQPISSATIRLQLLTKGIQTFTTSSDSSGRFAFANLEEGDYDLSAELKGYKKASIQCSLASNPAANEITITLAPEESAPAAHNDTPKYYDEPQFTISSVTDTTSLGGHGSDAVMRTRNSLAKETVSLNKSAESKPSDAASRPTRESLETERDCALALVAHDPKKAEPHHILAEVDEKLGESLSAVREYQRAAELDPREAYLFDWGSELLLHHAPEPALEVFTKGNRLFPHSERMLLGMGTAWFELGSLDVAVEKFHAAYLLAPQDSVPYLFIGKMESTQQNCSATALEMLRQFVTLHPDNADANYYYASAFRKNHPASLDTALAAQVEALLHKAIQIDPKFVAAYVEMGIVHADQRNFEKAIADYQQAIQIDSQIADNSSDSQSDAVAEAHFRLGSAYRQIGKRDKAAMEFKSFDRMTRDSAQKTERERHEIRQFVYTLRDQSAAQVQ
jgi:tetratricopeptide (TPR) repeat protein